MDVNNISIKFEANPLKEAFMNKDMAALDQEDTKDI